MVGRIHPDQDELKVDIMVKKSQEKSFFKFENYYERVFVLSRESLIYFEGTIKQRGSEKGRIALCDILCVEPANDKDQSKKVFQVAYEKDGIPLVLYVFTKTQVQRDDWIDAIRAETLCNRAHIMKYYHPAIWNRQEGFTCCGAPSRGDEGCMPASRWISALETAGPLNLRPSKAGEVMVDMMAKRSQGRSFFFGVSNYKERVFALDACTLRYFSGTLKNHGEEKCSIDLDSILAVEKINGDFLDKRKNAFQVVYKAEKDILTLCIVARTAEKCNAWIEAIRRGAMKNNAQFMSTYHPGTWLKSMGKYNCCNNISKKILGCEPVTLNFADFSKAHHIPGTSEHEVKVGLLTKRSQNRTAFFAFHKYKRRIFVLDNKSLRYFSRKDFKKRQNEKCCIDLISIVVVGPVDDGALDGNKHCLQVMYQDRDQFFILYMIAKDSQQQLSWINAVAAEACKTGAILQSRYHCGVWIKSFGKFTCCGQLTKETQGCKDIATAVTNTYSPAPLLVPKQQRPGSSSSLRSTLSSSSDSSHR